MCLVIGVIGAVVAAGLAIGYWIVLRTIFSQDIDYDF